MDNLLEAINDYYHNHGQYPQVKVSWEFYLKHIFQVDNLYLDGLDVDIDTKDETVDQWELKPPS